MTDSLRFRVLGAVGVELGAKFVDVTARRQRALLALLLLNANRSMTANELIDGIWGDHTPKHPDTALQIVVSRLRSALGEAADHVRSTPTGYSVAVASHELDLSIARARHDEGTRAIEAQDAEHAATVLDDALACWSGDALADLLGTPTLDQEARTLRDLRFAIYELRNDAYLQSGRHVEMLADVEAWVRDEPWRERLRAQQMAALYRSGRQVEALAVYDSVRDALLEELGIDPSTGLQNLSLRILEQDPTLLARDAGVHAPLPAWSSRRLPFVGRGREEMLIVDRLRDVSSAGARVVLVEGDPGIGKSRLVLEVARRLQPEIIVVAVDTVDTLAPGVQAVARALADVSTHLTDAELRLCLGRFPGDLAAIVPALAERFPDLPEPLRGDAEARAERMREAVVSWVAGLSQRAPVVLLLDDLHRAGPALLTLIGRLVVSDEPHRVLVVATARSELGRRGTRLEQLLRRLDRRGLLDRVELRGLDEVEIARLLTEMAPASRSRAHDLTRATGGNPLLLGELLHDPSGTLIHVSATGEVRTRIREFVGRRVADLGPGAEVVELAALIGREFDVSLLAELSRGTPRSTRAVLDDAIEADLVHLTGAGTFDFVHDLTRAALIELCPQSRRAVLHAEIARALMRRRAIAGEIAAHWARATGDDAQSQLCYWADAAGEEALTNLDPHAAATWFDQAARSATAPQRRAHLLVRLADARAQAGEPGAGEAMREALAVCRELDDTRTLVEIGRGWTPIWSSIPSLPSEERVAVLREAVRHATEPNARAQLLARLATQLLYTRAHHDIEPLLDEAIRAAREESDPAVLSETLLRHAYATATPRSLEARRANLAEAIELTRTTDDVVLRFYALSIAASAAVEAVAIDDADELISEATTLAAQVHLPMLAFGEVALRSWRVGLEGRLDEAEQLAIETATLGAKSRVEHAPLGPLVEIGCLRWLQERSDELLPFVQIIQNAPKVVPLQAVSACALASSPDTRADANARLEAAARDDFAALPHDVFWSTALVFAGDAALTLGNAAVGEKVLRALLPYRDKVAFPGTWVFAPIAYGAAVGAAAARRPEADELFADAIDVARRLRAPVMEAKIMLTWARALEQRDHAGARERAFAYAEDARVAFAGFQMQKAEAAAEAVRRRVAANVSSIRAARRKGTRAS